MNTEENNQAVGVDTINNNGESANNDEGSVVSIPKGEYDTLNQTLGSLKRELKDLKKSKTDSDTTPTKNDKSDDKNRSLERIEKIALRTANISHEDDIELARNTAKKWGVDIEDVILDEDFKVKLEKQQMARDNIQATSKIRGGNSTSQAKNTPEYWLAKGTPPSATDVPDRKTRVAIAKAFMNNTKSSKKFYND